MSIDNYIRKVDKELLYRATWMPDSHMELGAVGTFKKGVFQMNTSLSKLGIEYSTLKDESEGDKTIKSDNAFIFDLGTTVQIPFEIEAIKDISAKMKISFKGESGYYMYLRGVSHNMISDFYHIQQQIIKLFEIGKWDRQWMVITEVVSVSNGTILISSGSDASIELAPKISIGNENVEKLSAEIEWKALNSRNMSIEIVSKNGITPLFRARQVKKMRRTKKLGFYENGDEWSLVDVKMNELYS